MKDKLFIDMEYVESDDRTSQRHVCCGVNYNGVEYFFDLRNDTYECVNFLNNIPKGTVFLAYNISAEITSMLRMGISIETIRSFDWIDLWVEAKMFMLTHEDYYTKKKSLKEGAVPAFNLSYRYDMSQDPVSTIVNNVTYTDYQFSEIKKYNIADVFVLLELLEKLKPLWKEIGVTYSELLFRGKFARECAINYHKSKGFPMDVDMIKKVFENREEVKYQVGMDCNAETGFNIYRAKVKKRPKELSFNIEEFSNFLKKFGLYNQWSKTDSKKVSTTEDEFEKWSALDSLLSTNKDLLQSIYYARSTIKQLNSTNLLEILTEDGYIRTPPFPFDQKSGRSSPKPSLGFILNLAPWLRMCIKPKPGKAFIAADWSQQEIALAGFFSGDQKLLASYKYDHYLINAREMGFIPKDLKIETLMDTLPEKEFDKQVKEVYKKERDMMKPTSLGIIYGMGIKSMAFRVEAAMGWVHDTEKKTLDMWDVDDGVFTKYQVDVSQRAYDVAEKFISGHKDYYTTYWDYVLEHAAKCKELGYFKVPVSGWYYFVKEGHQVTQLQNIPNQSGGAAVMQLGYIIASEKYGLSIVCSLHDALYVECDLIDVEETKQKLLQAMAEAVSIFTDGKVVIRNDVKVFTEESPYTDRRGTRTYKLIKDLVNEVN